MKTTRDPDVIFISDNHIMNGSARSPLRHVLRAPFSPRAWAELAYAVVSALFAVCALIFIVPTLVNGPMWALSAPGVRKLGAAAACAGWPNGSAPSTAASRSTARPAAPPQ